MNSNWAKGTNAVHFLNAMQPRGGRQKEDTNYNPEAFQPQPTRPSLPQPQHSSQQNSQYPPFGQSSSYYDGHPQSPFPPVSSPPQYSSPPPSTHSYSPPNPAYDPNSNQGFGPPPPSDPYTNQQPGYGNNNNNTFGPPIDPQASNDGIYSDPQYNYSGHGSTGPQSPPQNYPPQQPPYAGPPPPVQRSYTMPTNQQSHDCNQHLDPILGRCIICQPIQRSQTFWPTGA